MIEDVLLQYGVLGAWTVSMLYERYTTQKRILAVIEKNTKVINEISIKRKI